MNKQKIEEGIDAYLEQLVAASRMYPNKNMMSAIVDFRQAIIDRLNSQGVVRRIQKPTPLVPDNYETHAYVYLSSQVDMLKAGYVAVESLLEV